MAIQSTDLILNKDGSIFHLKLLPDELSTNILLVGDPGRVDMISRLLDQVELRKENREFKTVTGKSGNKRVTVISTGIGPDNIDIVLNELDALVNINLSTGREKEVIQSLNIIRIGTSGAITKEIPCGSYVMSEKSIGFDNLPHFYKFQQSAYNKKIEQNLKQHLNWPHNAGFPYVMDASEGLLKKFDHSRFIRGMTVSAPGFYGPQGRKLRMALANEDVNNKMKYFQFDKLRITNYEMESSAIYSLSKALGHEALTLCTIIANRETNEFLSNYHPLMEKLATKALENI